MIFTGKRSEKPDYITLSEEFFDGKETCLDVKVKMIYDGKEGDIINQYVRFTKVCNEQVSLYGRTRKAIKETIRICKDSDVLRFVPLYGNSDIELKYTVRELKEYCEKNGLPARAVPFLHFTD